MAPGELSVWASFHYHYHSVQRLSPGGGGGALPYVHIGAYYAPEHNDKKNLLWSITVLQFLPLRRPSFSKFIDLQALPSPPTAGLLWQARTQSVCEAPRDYSRPECQPDASYMSAPENPISHSSPLQSPSFARSSPLRMMISTVEPRYKEVGYNKTLLLLVPVLYISLFFLPWYNKVIFMVPRFSL